MQPGVVSSTGALLPQPQKQQQCEATRTSATWSQPLQLSTAPVVPGADWAGPPVQVCARALKPGQSASMTLLSGTHAQCPRRRRTRRRRAGCTPRAAGTPVPCSLQDEAAQAACRFLVAHDDAAREAKSAARAKAAADAAASAESLRQGQQLARQEREREAWSDHMAALRTKKKARARAVRPPACGIARRHPHDPPWPAVHTQRKALSQRKQQAALARAAVREAKDKRRQVCH